MTGAAGDDPQENVSSVIDGCPHRSDARVVEGQERARCGLLTEISGVEEAELLEVRRDACEACALLPKFHESRINSVHASLLYGLSGRVIERGGVSGCDIGKAMGIRNWAEENLEFDDGLEPVDFERLDRVGVASNCIHLGSELPPEGSNVVTGYNCLHVSREVTTADGCFICRHWIDRPVETHPASLRDAFQMRTERTGPFVTRWALGVTTTDRLHPTLTYCLDSLLRAGFETPRIFADGPVEIAARHRHLPLSMREPRLGAWPNYYLSLVELLMREPTAEAYMLVQDDTLFHDRENLREFLEQEILWPGVDTGAVSLYCSRAYTRKEPGWHTLDHRWIWGALAFIFPRDAALRLVADASVLEHRWSNWNRGRANIDVVVGRWAERGGLRVSFPSPSLAQHIGESSTLWSKARAWGSRRAGRFDGDRAAR